MSVVSIGLPFHNNATTLATAIRSVFAQTFQDWELVLLDDGSTDGSSEIARAVRDPRVRLISDGRNLGLTVRLNQLTREARGDYIVRMDGDDAMLPNRVARQVGVLDTRPEVDVTVSTSYLIDRGGDVYGIDSADRLGETAAMYLRARNVWFAHPAITARARWMLANPYDESFRLGQEKELFCRTYDASTFYKTSEPLLFYREAGTVKLRSYRAQRQTDRRILARYGRRLIGGRRSAMLVGVSLLKEGAYVSAYKAGLGPQMDARLRRHRAVRISLDERASAGRTLASVQQAPVPGLDA